MRGLAPWILFTQACSREVGSDGVEIRGRAYQFMSHDLLEGARVSLIEDPAITATTDAQGRFTLSGVPRGEPVTPQVEMDEHVTAVHQRFTLQDDLDPLYLQVVPTAIYDLLADLLAQGGIEVDPDACQVVTTVSEFRLAEAVSWEAFLDRGDAGQVEGATATISPESGQRLYFGETVAPDPALEATTSDGGVIWLNVDPQGVYTLTAAAEGLDFPEVEVGCAPGRFVNASPPWGLTAL